MTTHEQSRTKAGEIRPLNLVWRRASLDMVMEGHFIKEVLLGGLKRPVRDVMFDEQPGGIATLNYTSGVEGDSLFVVLRGDTSELLRSARRAGHKNLGVLQLGDEGGVNDRSFFADADYVFRHYWYPEIINPQASPPVYWVPNGYRTGVGPVDPARTLPMSCRQISGFFAGSLHPNQVGHERQVMVEVIRQAKLPIMVFNTPGFGVGVSPSVYAGFLGNAKFALAPSGTCAESIRLYDALEHGAIPICLEAPYLHAADALGALGTPPIIMLDHWGSLPAVFQHWMQLSPTRLEDRRLAVVDWWARFKRHCQAQVCDLIEASFDRASAPALTTN